MERGQRAIDLEQVDRIATALGMTPDGFIESAIRHASERRQSGNVYLPDGAFDPAATSTAPLSDEEVREFKQR